MNNNKSGIKLKNGSILDIEYIKNLITKLDLDEANYNGKDLDSFLISYHQPTIAILTFFNFYISKVLFLTEREDNKEIIKYNKDLNEALDFKYKKYGRALQVKQNEKTARFYDPHCHQVSFKQIIKVNKLSKRRLFLINYYIDLINQLQPLIKNVYDIDRKYGFKNHKFTRGLSHIDIVKIHSNLDLKFKVHFKYNIVKSDEINSEISYSQDQLKRTNIELDITENFYNNFIIVYKSKEYRLYRKQQKLEISKEINLGNLVILCDCDYDKRSEDSKKNRKDSMENKYIDATKIFNNLFDFDEKYKIFYTGDHDKYNELLEQVFSQELKNFLRSSKSNSHIINFKAYLEKTHFKTQLQNF